jgi:hypothetical protein
MWRSRAEAREKAEGSYDWRVDGRVFRRVLEDSYRRFANNTATL